MAARQKEKLCSTSTPAQRLKGRKGGRKNNLALLQPLPKGRKGVNCNGFRPFGLSEREKLGEVLNFLSDLRQNGDRVSEKDRKDQYLH